MQYIVKSFLWIGCAQLKLAYVAIMGYCLGMNDTQREKQILLLKKKGLSLRKIGQKFHISGERVRQIISPKSKRVWLGLSQNSRKTCFICRRPLSGIRKFCENCIKENKLDVGGKELVRGVARGRDNNTCQSCGYKWRGTEKKRLDVHHLDGLCGKLSQSYDSYDMLHKLITVCHKCHYNLHDHAAYGSKVK